MTKKKIIAVRHLRAGGRLIPVHFSRNAGGSVAGRAVLGAQDTPILDGPDPEAVLAVLRDVIDGLLLAVEIENGQHWNVSWTDVDGRGLLTNKTVDAR